MKINDIVEHAKGRRAKIYTRKPKHTIEPHKPQAPVGPMSETEVTLKPMPGAQEVDVDGKSVGTATTPQAATAISDLAKKGEFTPNTSDSQQPAPMEEEHDEHPETAKHYNDWMNSEHAPHDSDSGDDNTVFHKALHFLSGKVHPGDMEYHAHHMAKKFHSGLDEKHNHHGVDSHGDVGGDATDSLLSQIKAEPEDAIGHGYKMYEMNRIKQLAGLNEAEQPAPAPTTTAIVPAADVDPAKTALQSTQIDPEMMQQVEDNTVHDAEGDVDLSATFQKIADQIPAEPQIRAEWAGAFKKFDERFSHIEQDPEFMKMSPEDQVKCKQDVQEVRALFQQFMEFAVQMSNGMKTAATDINKATQQPGYQNPLKGVKTLAPQQTPPVQETADDRLLKQMLSIAGLR